MATAPQPETLPRHELVGLDVEVVSASNPDLVGISGEVVTETTQTLGVETEGHVAHVPKADATFEFALPSDTADVVTVDGDRLVARPARRTEQTGDSKWR
jgi:ribonuclease P protein subunit POP4